MPQILMPYMVHLDHTLRVTPLNTLFAKGDSAAHRFELTIIRSSVQEDLTGCTVLGKFYRMADSTVVSVPGTVEGGNAVVALSKACYDYIGRFVLTIAIKNGDGETTVFYGDGYMHGQRADTAISGEYIIYDINTLLEKIAEIDAATQAANTATSNANTATANANTASDAANTAASTANTAATNANTAKDAANAATAKIDNMTVSATPVETGTATAALSTVDGHYHLALGLPKGDTGATPQISVQVQTGEAGSEASVSVSGTAEEPVIHLTIPRGDVGRIENLTINGKPVESGNITLTPEDLGAASAQEVSQLKDEKANKSIVSDAWQSGKTYAVGAYCIYNDRLYKALVQTTAEPTSNTDWTECTIADEIMAITPKNTEHKVITTDYGSIIFFAHDKVVSFYAALANMPTSNRIELGYVPFNPPNYDYVIFPTYYGNSPYIPVGSTWVYSNGKIALFKNDETTSAYVYGTYVTNN